MRGDLVVDICADLASEGSLWRSGIVSGSGSRIGSFGAYQDRGWTYSPLCGMPAHEAGRTGPSHRPDGASTLGAAVLVAGLFGGWAPGGGLAGPGRCPAVSAVPARRRARAAAKPGHGKPVGSVGHRLVC